MRRIQLFLAVALFASSLFAQADPLWKTLEDANKRFQGTSVTFGDLQALRTRLAPPDPGQKPPYAILSCSDSRVPPELVFALKDGLGELFVVRAAGNVADAYAIASLEYAVSKGWTKMIVVLGHEGCGAVERALDPKPAESPSILALITRIRESFDLRVWRDPANVRLATEANARHSADCLLATSDILRDAVLKRGVKLVVAYYTLKDGVVVRIDG